MTACAVALVLLLDASASIRPDEWRLQAEATAAAFEDPAVQRAILREGAVAVTALAFSERAMPMVGWRVLRDAEGADRFARELRAAPRGPELGTDIGGALDAGLRALDAAPCTPEREVLDLSTDGEAPAEAAEAARDAATLRGARINAIAVGPAEAADWLRAHAVTPGGFVIAAEDWADYPAAIRRKLTLEVASR